MPTTPALTPHPSKTLMAPCRVPWMVAPTMSCLTLLHAEVDEPECTVVFGAGRPNQDGFLDRRRIEITFYSCIDSRFRFLGDEYELNNEGFILPALDGPRETNARLTWFMDTWKRDGVCPQSGFWISVEPVAYETYQVHQRHRFVVAGRDGYTELVANAYSWKEWIWEEGHSADLALAGPPFASGRSEDLR